MKIYVTGYTGFVGKELLKRGFTPLVCDITDQKEVERVIKKEKPDLLIHLASKSDVDFCQNIDNQKIVENVNVWGTRYIFDALDKYRLPGVFISSDQVWGGGIFEKHDERQKPTPPVNFYGISKLIAEQYATIAGGKIIRTSYLFNHERLYKKILSAKAGLKQDYPVFIQRSFLHVQHFADMLEMYCDRFYKMPHILNLAGNKRLSWYRFMREIENQYSLSNTVKPRYFEKKGFAPRPWFGGLDVSLSLTLGFKSASYISGIERMKNEG